MKKYPIRIKSNTFIYLNANDQFENVLKIKI